MNSHTRLFQAHAKSLLPIKSQQNPKQECHKVSPEMLQIKEKELVMFLFLHLSEILSLSPLCIHCKACSPPEIYDVEALTNLYSTRAHFIRQPNISSANVFDQNYVEYR